MNIGLLNVQNITYTHQASAVPFPPSQEENGACKWLWNDAYDSAIDAHYTLENESFVGAVSLKIGEASVKGVCVLIDQKPCGAYRAETGKLTGGEIKKCLIPTLVCVKRGKNREHHNAVYPHAFRI